MQSITQFLTSLLSGFSSSGSGSLNLGQTLIALLLAYLGGILASLTPCVYPMIPITVSVVGGMPIHQRASAGFKGKWREVMGRAFAYIFGMTIIYSFLGVAAGLTGRVFGSFTNTPTWYIALSIIMTAGALIMLDVIPFDPMVWLEGLKRRMGKTSSGFFSDQGSEMNWIGAFALGASSGFIAAPCTTPVLTSVLAYIAKTQSIGMGLGLMIAYSLGLSTLLLTIAGFAGAIQVLPRSGQWMKSVKKFSGFILLIYAGYLVFQAGQRNGI